MKRATRRVSWFWIAALAALPGCSLDINGAVGAADKAPAYEEFEQFRRQVAREQALRNRKVQFERHQGLAPEARATLTSTRWHPRSADTRTLRLFGTTERGGLPAGGLLSGVENIEQVTFGTIGDDFDPDVDSTGRRIVFASTRHHENSDLYVADVGSTSLTLVVSDPARDEMPAFSPSGESIAFASNRRGNWDIFISHLDGGAPIQLTTSPVDEIHPSYAPDGKSIVYSVYAERAAQWKIVVVDVAQPGQVRFITDGLFPQWSPQGDKILFQRARAQLPRSFSIWTVDLVDGEARKPTEIVRCVNAAAITPTWSPDGRHIVFSTVVSPGAEFHDEAPGQADVWMVAADGTSRVNLTRSPFANLQPVWSSTGAVFFVSNRADSRRESIWALRTDAPLRLTRDVLGEPTTPLAGGADTAAPMSETAAAAGEGAEMAATSEATEP